MGFISYSKGLIQLNVIEYLGRGILHERNNLPCQDAVGHKEADNGNMIMVLSDGAGSARFAEQAAWEIVYTVIDYFGIFPLSKYVLLDEEEKKKSILAACSKRLHQLSDRVCSTNPYDFSATLQFCVYDGRQLLVGHLGDGAVFCFNKHCHLLFYSEQENMGEQKNRTYFTSSHDACDHLHIHVAKTEDMPVDMVLMASDGTCLMFENRGEGFATETAKEIVQYVQNGIIHSNAELAEMLNQMAEVPSERLDDWSVLLWSRAAELEEECPNVVSMLEEEQAKYVGDRIYGYDES